MPSRLVKGHILKKTRNIYYICICKGDEEVMSTASVMEMKRIFTQKQLQLWSPSPSQNMLLHQNAGMERGADSSAVSHRQRNREASVGGFVSPGGQMGGIMVKVWPRIEYHFFHRMPGASKQFEMDPSLHRIRCRQREVWAC